jgi:hypothetical protein
MNKTISAVLFVALILAGVHIYDLTNRLREASNRPAKTKADLQEKFSKYFPKLDTLQANFKELDGQLRKNQALIDASSPDSRAYRELLFLEYAVTRSLNWASDLLYLYALSPEFKLRTYVTTRLSDLAEDIQSNIDVSSSFLSSGDPFIKEAVTKMRTSGREAILILTQAEDQVNGISE